MDITIKDFEDVENIPENTMFIHIVVDPEGGMRIAKGHNFGDDIPEDIGGGYLAILNGFLLILDLEPELLLRAWAYAAAGHFFISKEKEADRRMAAKLDDAPGQNVVKFNPFNREE